MLRNPRRSRSAIADLEYSLLCWLHARERRRAYLRRLDRAVLMSNRSRP